MFAEVSDIDADNQYIVRDDNGDIKYHDNVKEIKYVNTLKIDNDNGENIYNDIHYIYNSDDEYEQNNCSGTKNDKHSRCAYIFICLACMLIFLLISFFIYLFYTY